MIRPDPSHPLLGWSFSLVGTLGLALGLALHAARCRQQGVGPWPDDPVSVAVLAGVVRDGLPAALALVLGFLLPLQQMGNRPARHRALARILTMTPLLVLGGYWLARMNLVGFGSLWSRPERLGELTLPAALVENRVWWANIMVVLALALMALPLHSAIVRALRRRDLRRAPWFLWLTGSVGWLGLAAALLLAGRP
jgi:hypothetical protein